MERRRRSIAKAISWRVIATLLTFSLSLIWLEWRVSLLLALIVNLIKTGAYYFHERGWNLISWGRSPIKEIDPKGVTVWFTGLPSSGKSTIADALANNLKRLGLRVERLDADIIRKNLWKELGYSKEDRDENIRRVTYLARLLTRNGIVTITSFISPYKELREYARKEIGSFVEVYVKCPVEVCMQRDPKGLYQKALAGEIQNFTGISDPYEEPTNPEVLIESDKETIEQSVNKVLNKLRELKYI